VGDNATTHIFPKANMKDILNTQSTMRTILFLKFIMVAAADNITGARILEKKLPAMPYKPHQTQTHTNSLDDRRNKSSLGDIVSCGSCCFEIEDATAYSNLSPSFYSKVIDMDGFLIASSSATSDAALYEAALTVAKMNKDRSDLLSILIEEGVHLTVIGKDEVLTDVPEYTSLGSGWDWTRGVGATQWIPVTSCAEENLLCLGYPEDVYDQENVCIHETAHTLQGSGGKLPTQRFVEEDGSEDLDNAVRQQFIDSVNGGLWKYTYAGSNHEEYWAEGVQSFYNANTEGLSGGDGIHNNINTRAELKEYDIGLYNIISRVFPLDASLVCPDSTCDCASFVCPGANDEGNGGGDDGEFAICFSGKNDVLTMNKGKIPTKDLQIGDMVHIGEGEFSRVYSFGHHSHDTKAEYLQLHVESRNNPLEISKDHMVFIGKNRAVPAFSVSIGDQLILSDENNKNTNAKVTKITKVERVGAYAPFTESGTIIVNGLLASNYVSLQEEESGSFTVVGVRIVSMHWLAHAFQAPHRLFCRLSSNACSNETYTKEGISHWVSKPLIISHWFLRQHVIVTAILSIPVVCLAFALHATESLLSFPVPSIVILFVAITLHYLSKAQRLKQES